MEMYPDPEWDAVQTGPLPMATVSSSPLKTASSISTVDPSTHLMSTISAYLTKYCEIASGGRVKFQGAYGFGSAGMHSWVRFKCVTCQDNWNVKSDLFVNNTNPKELTDWVEKHKHVCKEFKPQQAGNNPKCASCQWPWSQHTEAQPMFNPATGQWEAKAVTIKVAPGKVVSITSYQGRSTGVRPCAVCEEPIAVASGSPFCDECFKAAKKVHETKSLTQKSTEGRMFRRKEETRCESTATDQPTSLDSLSSTTTVSKG